MTAFYRPCGKLKSLEIHHLFIENTSDIRVSKNGSQPSAAANRHLQRAFLTSVADAPGLISKISKGSNLAPASSNVRSLKKPPEPLDFLCIPNLQVHQVQGHPQRSEDTLDTFPKLRHPPQANKHQQLYHTAGFGALSAKGPASWPFWSA